MQRLLLFFICLITSATVAGGQTNFKLKIGAKLPRKDAAESNSLIATHPSQTRPFIQKTICGVKYIIAFEEETRKIRFIHTLDRNFRTTMGLRVGSQLTVTRAQITIYPSWYILAPGTPDGWQPIVIGDEELLGKLKDGEGVTVTIGGFIKGGN